MPFTQSHLLQVPANVARKPKPVTRKRLYATGSLVLAGLAAWGVITADEAEAYAGVLERALAAAALFMASSNVSSSS